MVNKPDNQQRQLEAKLFKGFADTSRLAILETIIDGPKTVSEIVEATKLSQPNTSTHLACLLDCGLVQKKQEGRNVFYALSSSDIRKLIKLARSLVQQHAKELYECTHY